MGQREKQGMCGFIGKCISIFVFDSNLFFFNSGARQKVCHPRQTQRLPVKIFKNKILFQELYMEQKIIRHDKNNSF